MANDQVRPTDFGFPAKFRVYNPGQYDAALRISSSEKRFFMLPAPTGSGKSLICATVGSLLGGRTLVLMGNKGLQSQWMSDFEESGLTDMRGQANYRCVALDRQLRGYGKAGASCAEGPCKVGVYCSLKESGCTYFDAQRDAAKADFVMTNYAYWMSLGRHSDPDALGKFDTLILDEAHDAKDWLSDFCAVSLNKAEVLELIGMRLPRIDEGTAAWARWAKGALRVTQGEQAAEREAMGGLAGMLRQQSIEKLHRLSRLNSDLTSMSSAGEWKLSEGAQRDVRVPGLTSDWVAEEIPKGVRYTPVWAHAYAESILFRGIKRVVLTSATITKADAKYLGINALTEMDYHELPSTFDPKNRPFFWVPTTRIDRNMIEGQWNLLMAKVDRLIAARQDRKGVFHSRSYAYTDKILKSSDHSAIMMTHQDSRGSRQVVEEFKRAGAPALLVSPSVEQGFDFPGLECTYQIILKVPFPDMRSPVMKARSKSDDNYINHVAATAIVQTAGRGNRRPTDVCETFIFDDHWMWFRNRAQFPRWFSVSWRTWEIGLPAPPSLENLYAASINPTSTKPSVQRRSSMR